MLVVFLCVVSVFCCIVFFFFSSRRRHTRSYGDWSSDVCSSDLERAVTGRDRSPRAVRRPVRALPGPARIAGGPDGGMRRSEERREGKSVDLGGRRIIKKKKEL